ncbi:Pentatricopeptide repeat-containing protein -mitochondrial [Striga hermonthica]|uniref:Pentatricopeptide repeat-containing protein -mitochondrial n=1 Tax=Striga hermonthica TaxID=68872 RepID=A0A9N7NH88_STRHE|nr:Pentatricopeptide repeat-containing protein -mitochondrial [Striga hermonthica]
MNVFSLSRTKFPRSPFSKSLATSSYPEIDSIQSISENPIFGLLKLCRTLSRLQKVHALLIVSGEARDSLLKTKLAWQYGAFGRLGHARRVFDQIPNPDFDLCKAMMRRYFMSDLHLEVIGFYRFMRSRFYVLDNMVISTVLKACTELRDLVEGRKLHGYVVQMGSPDSFVLTGLVDMYAKCGEISTARKVFEKIQDRNVVCWTSMIVGYVKNNCAREALVLFNRMRDCMVEGNEYTLGSMISACGKLESLHQGRWVHGNVIKNGVRMNPRLFASVVDMYIKCGSVCDARLFFDEFGIVDLVSWTTMIVGYAQNGFSEQALLLFTDKNWKNVCPNAITLSSVLSACAQSGNYYMGSLVHGLGIKLGQNDNSVMNALVDMYAKCRKIEDAVNLFESMSYKDVVAWNSIISGYYQNRQAHKSLRLFGRMRLDSFRPDAVTVVAVLSACASLGDISLGCSLHAYSIREGFLASNSVYIGTAILNLYAKCGDTCSARKVFNEMSEKNGATWSAMIDGYGKQGNPNECLAILNTMLKEKVEPTDIIFTTVLSAYSHTGMMKEGWGYFGKLCREYDFVPKARHYSCMVDWLARSGNLEEALEFIEKMPVEPDCAVLGSFLHGCSLHSRFDLGDRVVRKMLERHPDDPGHYMLMSNYSASKGRWSQASELRGLMRKKGLKKQIGCSRVGLCSDEVYSQRAATG